MMCRYLLLLLLFIRHAYTLVFLANTGTWLLQGNTYRTNQTGVTTITWAVFARKGTGFCVTIPSASASVRCMGKLAVMADTWFFPNTVLTTLTCVGGTSYAIPIVRPCISPPVLPTQITIQPQAVFVATGISVACAVILAIFSSVII